MQTKFYDDTLELEDPSIFLAGPTANGIQRTPWRARALELLADFEGTVVIPEFRATPFVQAAPRVFGEPASPAPRMKATTFNILRWETTGIERSTVALFWMPFVIAAETDPASLPGFTTRAEVARELARAPHRIVLGMPPDGVVSAGHIRYHAHRQGVAISDTLEEAVERAVALARTIKQL